MRVFMSLELNIIDGKYKFSGRSLSPSIEKNSLLKPYHKQLCCYGVKLCLLPTNEQKEKLNQQIGNARFVRNQYLSSRMAVYNSSKSTLTVSEYKKSYLPKLKEENPKLSKLVEDGDVEILNLDELKVLQKF